MAHDRKPGDTMASTVRNPAGYPADHPAVGRKPRLSLRHGDREGSQAIARQID